MYKSKILIVQILLIMCFAGCTSSKDVHTETIKGNEKTIVELQNTINLLNQEVDQLNDYLSTANTDVENYQDIINDLREKISFG